MDGKPQRPLKSLRGVGDENVIQPELHKKYQSTGALSAKMMAAGGGLRAAAKRTAFNDLSNTNKLGGAVLDDSAIYFKDNEVKKVQVAANTSLLRPPMRLTAPVNNSYGHPLPATKQVQSNKATAIPSKRTNPVFKDSENEQLHSHAPANFQSKALVHLRSNRNGDNSDLPVIDGRKVSVQEFYEIADAKLAAEEARTRAAHLALVEYKPVEKKQTEKSQAEQMQVVKKQVEKKQGEKKEDDNNAVYRQYMQMVASGLTDESLPAIEGYGHQDSDIEDEDDDYTTAHSWRSRGDNTTGCVTTVLRPQITSKVRAELDAAREVVERTKGKRDFDDEAWDTNMVAEYGEEIFDYMREQEMDFIPPANYMEIQGEIQWSMRAVLIDWMVQVHGRFGLLPETLYLCVNCIDRFLSIKVVSLGKLQLVGATALLIAAKYEEINCPSIAEVVFMVDGGYTAEEILKAERFMLLMLQFQLGAPGPLSFLRRISKADEYDPLIRTTAKYFMEVTIMDERFVTCPASFIAAGAACAARIVLRKPDWTAHHIHYSGYTFEQLRPLVCLMLQCCENAGQHHSAVFEKYSEKRYQRVSLIVHSAMITGVGVMVPGYKGSFHAFGSSVNYPADMPSSALTKPAYYY